MPSPEQQTPEQQTTGQRFGHTSGRRLPQYVHYGKDKNGRRTIVPPPVKARRVKPSRLFMADTHPLRRLVANWERNSPLDPSDLTMMVCSHCKKRWTLAFDDSGICPHCGAVNG